MFCKCNLDQCDLDFSSEKLNVWSNSLRQKDIWYLSSNWNPAKYLIFQSANSNHQKATLMHIVN